MINTIISVLLGLAVLGFVALHVLLLISYTLQNRHMVQYVREQFGITINNSVADSLNDHRSSKENMYRVDEHRVLVKTFGKDVELRTLS